MEFFFKESNNIYQFDSNFRKAWVTSSESVHKDHLAPPPPYSTPHLNLPSLQGR